MKRNITNWFGLRCKLELCKGYFTDEGWQCLMCDRCEKYPECDKVK